LNRYIRSMRDIGQWVHVDALFQAYHCACLILLGMGAPLDPGLPPVASRTQAGFVEFGGPHVLTLVTEVATRALKATWYEKWLVHRRLRPEAFAARVHHRMTGAADYPVHPAILHSAAAQAVYSRYGTYLLPMAFPEGSPAHPSYTAGHATVAGAGVTILKAFFDEEYVLPRPVVPDADGLTLQPYAGPPLTVGNELNKLANNIGIGRNMAGVHYRSDNQESLLLGEAVALQMLAEQKACHNQRFTWSLTTFDGQKITL
jgi:PAP2 superfamily